MVAAGRLYTLVTHQLHLTSSKLRDSAKLTLLPEIVRK